MCGVTHPKQRTTHRRGDEVQAELEMLRFSLGVTKMGTIKNEYREGQLRLSSLVTESDG